MELGHEKQKTEQPQAPSSVNRDHSPGSIKANGTRTAFGR